MSGTPPCIFTSGSLQPSPLSSHLCSSSLLLHFSALLYPCVHLLQHRPLVILKSGSLLPFLLLWPQHCALHPPPPPPPPPPPGGFSRGGPEGGEWGGGVPGGGAGARMRPEGGCWAGRSPEWDLWPLSTPRPRSESAVPTSSLPPSPFSSHLRPLGGRLGSPMRARETGSEAGRIRAAFHVFSVTHREAERLLETEPQGCYLVRFSESAVTFVLTYRCGAGRCARGQGGGASG